MASRDRDFKVSILTDLEDTGVTKAADSLDTLGDQASTTARKVDGAFEKIAASSRSNLRKVDADADRARKGLDDFKDEAHDTGREAAASFSGGFEDITDAVQEISANAFAKLGKAGMAAGGILAVGLGFVISKAQEANEKVAALRDTYFELMKSGDANDPAKAIQEFVNSLDTDQLSDFGEALETTGISKRRFFQAMSGDAQAAREVRAELARMVGSFNMPWDAKAREAQHLYNVLNDAAKGAEGAAVATDTYKEVLGETAPAVDTATTAIAAQASAVDKITGSIHDSIAEVGDAKSEIDDLVTKAEKGGRLSLAAMTKTLAEQTKAARTQRANLQKAMNEGGAEFAEFMAGLPAEAAAAYAAASPKQRAAFRRAAFDNMGVPMTEGTVAGMDSKVPAVEAAALRTRAAAKRAALGDGPITIPTTVGAPPAGAVAQIRRDVQNGLKPVVIPVMLQNVAPSTFSRYVP